MAGPLPPARLRATAALLATTALAWMSLASLAPVCTAIADGDPASDVLLGENVYYPFAPAVSAALQKTLNDDTAAAKRAGLPIKVALIDSPPDLGVLTNLFGKPQRYADFLDQEISFRVGQPLLVVMPAGFGVQGVNRAARIAAGSLSRPAGGQSDDLAWRRSPP
ncbi:MAG: hypothetical protein ACR2OB_13625 [Solirubrobacteraceae bacterium]